MDSLGSISDNVARIRETISAAAKKTGRDASDITLVGVTKTIDVQRMEEMVSCGITDIGENKVQEIINKLPYFSDKHSDWDLNWHLIGHLQTNKVKYIIDKVSMIHSVDSLKLGQEISKRALLAGKAMKILLEINIAGEENKSGVSPQEAENLAVELNKLEGVILCGLMCVPPYVEIAEHSRKFFTKIRQLFIDIRRNMPDNINMKHLSMGMTNDFNVAIEEGATIVRVGTGIFGERKY